MVLIPRAAAWLPEFNRELLAFPNGRYDDQVDSMTQFLDWIGRRRGRAKCELRLNGGRPLVPPRPQGSDRHEVRVVFDWPPQQPLTSRMTQAAAECAH